MFFSHVGFGNGYRIVVLVEWWEACWRLTRLLVVCYVCVCLGWSQLALSVQQQHAANKKT